MTLIVIKIVTLNQCKVILNKIIAVLKELLTDISALCLQQDPQDNYLHFNLITDPLLPKEQAGFQCGASTVDQVVLLTQNIANSFKIKKAGGVFVNLFAAYDTV